MFKTIIASMLILGTTLPVAQPALAAVTQTQETLSLSATGWSPKLKFEAYYDEESYGSEFGQKFVVYAHGTPNTKYEVLHNGVPFAKLVFEKSGAGVLTLSSEGGAFLPKMRPGDILVIGPVKAKLAQ